MIGLSGEPRSHAANLGAPGYPWFRGALEFLVGITSPQLPWTRESYLPSPLGWTESHTARKPQLHRPALLASHPPQWPP
jgi:hypothetical protein